MLPIRTILHPTDFSRHADYALRVAGSIAQTCGARLIVLHVLRAAEPPAWLSDRMAGSFPWSSDGLSGLDQRLQLLRESTPGLRAEGRAVEGSPAVEILRAAREERSDLIIMGTQGRTGPEEAVMGSVSAEIVRSSGCPVLTVKDPAAPASTAPGPAGVPGAESILPP